MIIMKRFLLPAIVIGGVAGVVVACGGTSSSDITDSTGAGDGGGDANGNVGVDGSGGNGNDSGGVVGSDSGSSSDSGSANDAGGTACTIDATGASVGCGKNEYCASTNCATGVCAPVPNHTSDNAYVPQCGCDGVTYWNKAYAALGGESISAAGVCTDKTTPKALSCVTGSCPKGAAYACAAELTACGTLPPEIPELCWYLPPSGQCPDKPQVESCSGAIAIDAGLKCTGLCAAIDSKTVFARNPSCN